MAFVFLVVVRKRTLMHIASAFTLEYDLPVLEFLVKDLWEHKPLVEGVSLPPMVRAKAWILLLYLRQDLVHKQQLDDSSL